MVGRAEFDGSGWHPIALSALAGSASARDGHERGEDVSTPRSDVDDSLAFELPEETLYQLVVDNGGRTKQSTLVEQTSWSASRVSRKLKNLEEVGWVRRVRQGRENVVFVPASN